MSARKDMLITMLMRARHNARREGRGQMRLAASNPDDAAFYLERAMRCAEYSMAARQMIVDLGGRP